MFITLTRKADDGDVDDDDDDDDGGDAIKTDKHSYNNIHYNY